MRLGPLRNAVIAVFGLAVSIGLFPANADEGGVSFWLPGQYGSFAAVPGEPGWSIGTVYYYTSVKSLSVRERVHIHRD